MPNAALKPRNRSTGIFILVVTALVVAACAKSPRERTATRGGGNFVPLFNGRDLGGWLILPGGFWQVSNGILVGRSGADEPRHGILLTRDRYRDFELRVEYRAVRGNSGLYFRVERVGESHAVAGLQAEIDARHDAGGLYETGGREWLVKPTPDQTATWFRPGDWNEMRVIARGRAIQVLVNGRRTAELADDHAGRREGHIGLQLHGHQDVQVEFRVVEIRPL